MKIVIVIMIAALALPMGLQAANAQAQAAYLKGCKACHGPQGEGNPAIAKMLNVTLNCFSAFFSVPESLIRSSGWPARRRQLRLSIA